MGNGYFRTSQTRKDKRKTKEFTFNYVDRVRLAESSLQDHKCPTRGSGWRHNKSISHLDLATSCHSAASGLNHWSQTRQLRHSRSLDYNHIDRCKDALDIAEYYWRIDPEADNYDELPEHQQQQQHQQLKSTHNDQHYRDYTNYADENYHSTNSIYQHQQLTGGGGGGPPPHLQAFDFGNDSCSLRRSRSLAVIREETFSDLQITSANSSRRRSQLIPRARLVNRGFFRERERLICGNNKHHHHHHAAVREQQQQHQPQQLSNVVSEQDAQSNGSGAGTCDSHQHRHHHHHHNSDSHHQSREADDYYDNLKRLDALAVGLAEQLHPWHGDKSDLESLNSDYFKNSLHQSHELKQHLEFEALEQAVSLLASEKPRIYQSRRQQQQQRPHSEHLNSTQHKLLQAAALDSCPENSQSSLFPETTTSNSDDQTDTPSLSEQEYDLTKIEEIFQQAELEADEESYELISLTTTTRTRIETTEDEEEDEQLQRDQRAFEDFNEHTTTDTEIEIGGTLKRTRALSENLEKLIAYDSVYLSSEESSDSTLVEENREEGSELLEEATQTVSLAETSTLLHISIEDSVYEPQAKQHKPEIEVERDEEESQQEATRPSVKFAESVNTKTEILDHKSSSTETTVEASTPPFYTQILKVEHTPTVASTSLIPTSVVGVTSSAASKPNILSVVEKRKLKRYSDSSYASHTSSAVIDHPPHATANSSHTAHPPQESHFTHLKRQATDSLYKPFKANLGDNQYHSLPDFSIGQSLKVSECIDAKLRSSYNLNKYQRAEDEVADCRLREAKSTTALILENHKNKLKQREEIVTTEEIYDSIKRFGRAHQKARQKEYQELHELELDKEKNEVREVTTKELRDKQTKLIKSESEPTTNVAKQLETTAKETEPVAETLHPAEAVASDEHDSEYFDSIVEANPAREIPRATDAFDYLEKPKEAPNIEVANFSKQIERRAQEILASSSARQAQRNQETFEEFSSTTFTTATFRINKSALNFPKTNTSAEENEDEAEQDVAEGAHHSGTHPFRIIVTDAQNNIIEEDSIDGSRGESLTTAPPPAPPLPPSHSHPLDIKVKREFERKKVTASSVREVQREIERKKVFESGRQVAREIEHKTLLKSVRELNKDIRILRDIKIESTKAKEKLKDKSTIVNSSSSQLHRVATLKRVPSKPKRQQHSHQQHPHGCQHQNKASSSSENNNATNSKNNGNYCELSPKSKERRVLSTQIYKARPIKVLSASDSLRRTKMSRPQILHVVDNKRNADLGVAGSGSGAIINNAKIEGSQVENEYLKKVDAVRCYWTKLAKDEKLKEQQTAREQPPQEQSNQHQPSVMENGNGQQPLHTHEPRQFILGATAMELRAKTPMDAMSPITTTTTMATTTTATKRNQDDFCSFMPSIEIVELDGEKTATIVSAVPPNSNSADTLSNDASEPQFDHIRYKVVKSQQLIRSNILPRNKKEAQFDGLIQYLQDYSFQELLSNNNVVIVEPVRTKIERPLMTTATTPTAASASATRLWQGMSAATNTNHHQQETDMSGFSEANGSGANAVVSERSASKHSSHANSSGGSGIKRHFFYQPVRVNRELYEEELPNPDTVRNVRKFFEKHILPTPGQGLLVYSGKTEDDEEEAEEEVMALGLPEMAAEPQSPKSRRARKYRYLTIDTSYGHAPQKANTKQLQHQPQSEQCVSATHSRKWDTASLSSGVSSGDLSSPCECNDAETMAESVNQAKSKTEQNINGNVKAANMIEGLELKGLHVQDVVRRHNNTNDSNTMASSAAFQSSSSSSGIETDAVREIRAARPRSAIYGPSGDSSYYRDIYEYNAGQQYSERRRHEADAVDGLRVERAVEQDDDNMFAGDDEDDELSESYYVSNDVLEKIRECGSSVTYYGGRVLQSSTPEPLCPINNGPLGGSANMAPHSTMTLTRARAREIETCSVCQPNECPHKKQLQDKFQRGGASGEKKPKEEQGNNNKEAYAGIKFKLVKSNSCSSRLELAGAADIIVEEETEVVRKMVHHFECHKKTKPVDSNDELLTINNQMPARKIESNLMATNATKQVTVNNHINVPVAVLEPSGLDSNSPQQRLSKTVSGHSSGNDHRGADKVVDKRETENLSASTQRTFHSSAMDIHLETSGRDKLAGSVNGSVNGNGNGNGTTKICRNKNVDLAFTMAKQPTKSSGTTGSSVKDMPKHVPHTTDRSSAETQSESATMNPHKMAKQKTSLASSGGSSVVTSLAKSLESNLTSRKDDDDEARKMIAMPMSTVKKSAGNSEKSYTENGKRNEPKIDKAEKSEKSHVGRIPNKSMALTPSQIIVPVEIHRMDTTARQQQVMEEEKPPQQQQQHCLSTTSSCASLIDKTVVRHYVANDKRLFEKRKYDDIEFEEFEVYDPTKDFEKLIESVEQEKEQQQRPSDGNQLPQQQLNSKSKSSSVSDLSLLNGEEGGGFKNSAVSDIKSKFEETDCYDSLDDKL